MVTFLPAITNYAPNPSAEVDTTGMSGSRSGAGTAVLTRVSDWNWVGDWSYKTTVTVAGPTAIFTNTAFTFADANKIPAVPGETWSVGAHVMTPQSVMRMRLNLIWYNSASAQIATISSAYVTATAGQDYYLTVDGQIAPAGTTHIVVMAYMTRLDSGAMAIGDAIYADGLMAVKGEVVPTYVDGSLGAYHHWTGTAHLSASYRDAIPIQQTAGSGGLTRVSSELWLANTDGTLLEDVSPLALEGRTVWNVHNDIKSALTLTALSSDLIVPYSSVVAPIIKLTDVNGIETAYQQGLYITTPPRKSHKQSYSTGQLEGKGLEWILANDYFGTSYSLAAGANMVAEAIVIIAGKGLRYSIPAGTATLPIARTWAADISKLQIVNDLLNGAGYYTVAADRYGVLKSVPYFELASANPALQLFSGEGSIVIDTVEQEGVYDSLANKIIVYKENTQGASIRVTRTNNDPASPVSTVSLGRVITRVIKDSNIASSTVARALAARAIEEASSYTNKLKVTTLPVPARELHEVYDLALYNVSGLPVAFGLWWCDGYELGFTNKTAKMVHSLKRLEAYGWDEVVV